MADTTAPPEPNLDEVEVTSHGPDGAPTDDPAEAAMAEACFGGQEYAIIVPTDLPARA